MNWKYTVDIKDLHDGFNENKLSIVEVAHGVAAKLKELKNKSSLNFEPISDAIYALEVFDETLTANDYDDILSDVYDWADNNKVWINHL